MPSVLCVDDHRDIAEIVQAVLVDEGYPVSCLYELAGDALLRAVGRLEPDCVLLDSSGFERYGDSAVASATGQSVRFDRSRQGENQRTRELVKALDAFGATDIRPSKLREWALFRDRNGDLCQVYWWQLRGVYQVGRYDDEGQLVMLGQFISRDAAIEIALPG